MANYVVKIEPAEGSNPEFAPAKKEQEGIECTGYIVITFDGDETATESASKVSIDMIKETLKSGGKLNDMIRAAAAVAEGEIKAREIMKEGKQKEAAQAIAELLKGAVENEQ